MEMKMQLNLNRRILFKICRLFEREIKEDYFSKDYKNKLHSIVAAIFQSISGLSRIDIQMIKILNNEDNPAKIINDIGYKMIPFNKIIVSLYFNAVLQLKNFIDNVNEPRIFWINNEIWLERQEDQDIDESMNNLEEKLEKHEVVPSDIETPSYNNSLTKKMIKYIIKKPFFLIMYVAYHSTFPVIKKVYEMLLKTQNDFDEMLKNRNKDDPEDEFVDSLSIEKDILSLINLKNIMKIMIDESLKAPNTNAFDVVLTMVNLFPDYLAALLIDLLSQKITENYNEYDVSFVDEFINILKLIEVIIDYKKSTIKYFSDLINGKILDIVILPICRVNKNILNKMFKLIKQNKYPLRATYLAGFMLLSNDAYIELNGLEIYQKLDKEQQKNLSSVITCAFDRALENTNFRKVIELIIECCPHVVNERKFELMNFLSSLIEQYVQYEDSNLFKIIGKLFTCLVPDRDKSTSKLAIIEKSSIPSEIMEQSPRFWRLFEKQQNVIINQIEQNPQYLNSFKFLLQYPELISFKIRSEYFRRLMHKKIKKNKLKFNVDSKNILSSSFDAFHDKSALDLLSLFDVTLDGEDQGGNETVDAGGVTRQWFTKLSKELFDINQGLFQCTKKLNLMSSPNSMNHKNHLEYFQFAGRFVARAIIEGICIDTHFTSSFCKQILHRVPTMIDLVDVDEDLYQNFEYTLMNKNVEEQYMVFEVVRNYDGKNVSIPLKENGGEIDVTDENKKEFVDLYVDFILRKEIEEQIKHFCLGFDELIPHKEIKMFTPNELDMLICGITNINVDDFYAHTYFEYPYNEDHRVIKMFFNVIRKWDNEKLTKLLFFITGVTHLPPNGFRGFCQISGYLMRIQAGGTSDDLPRSHTCFNTLDLPQYEDEDSMNRKLLIAIHECDSITSY